MQSLVVVDYRLWEKFGDTEHMQALCGNKNISVFFWSVQPKKLVADQRPMFFAEQMTHDNVQITQFAMSHVKGNFTEQNTLHLLYSGEDPRVTTSLPGNTLYIANEIQLKYFVQKSVTLHTLLDVRSVL